MSGWASEIEKEKSPTISRRTDIEDGQSYPRGRENSASGRGERRSTECASGTSRYGTTFVCCVADRAALLLNGQLVEVARTEKFFTNPSDPRTADFVQGRMVY